MNLRLFKRLLAFFAIATLQSVLSAPAFGATNNVAFGGVTTTFRPSSVTINVGDTVVWSNAGGFHTVTPDTGVTEAFCGTATITTSCSYTFNNPGTFGYHCVPHQFLGMTGTVIVQGVANTPPSVTITNPASGATFTAPANITVEASASDPGGSVAQVQFFVNGVSIGVDNVSPYSGVSNNVPAGAYTLSAVATDNLGAKTTNAISVTVNQPNIPPTISITNPPNAAVFAAPGSGTIQVATGDSDGFVTVVEFFGNGFLLGSSITPPFSLSVSNVTAGDYSLTARATDNQGGTATSAAVNISVVTPVAVSISSPSLANGQFQLTFTANAGLRYVLERATDLTLRNWVPVRTNTAGGGTVNFTNTIPANAQGFYRVGRLP